MPQRHTEIDCNKRSFFNSIMKRGYKMTELQILSASELKTQKKSSRI